MAYDVLCCQTLPHGRLASCWVPASSAPWGGTHRIPAIARGRGCDARSWTCRSHGGAPRTIRSHVAAPFGRAAAATRRTHSPSCPLWAISPRRANIADRLRRPKGASCRPPCWVALVVSGRSCLVIQAFETCGLRVSVLCVGWLFSPFSPCWWSSLRCFLWTFV